MQAAFYERTGPAGEVLCVDKMPIPDPGPGEVRVRVAWSGVNLDPIDPQAGMDLGEVKAKYGQRVALKGNVDCAQLLTFGTPDEVVTATSGGRVPWISGAPDGRGRQTVALRVRMPIGQLAEQVLEEAGFRLLSSVTGRMASEA
jgi:hypothetical protein